MRTFDPEPDRSSHDPGIEIRDIMTGFQGVAHREDGSSVKVWAPTEQQARAKAEAEL